jgi:hypothetical protein
MQDLLKPILHLVFRSTSRHVTSDSLLIELNGFDIQVSANDFTFTAFNHQHFKYQTTNPLLEALHKNLQSYQDS